MNSPAHTGVSWQWTGDQPNQWNAYDMDVACILEDAFCKSVRVIDLSQTRARLPYTLDFHAMTQTRNETGFARKLRRIKLNASYSQQAPMPAVATAHTGAFPTVAAATSSSAATGQSQPSQIVPGMKKKSNSVIHPSSPSKVARTRSQMKKTQSMPNPGIPQAGASGFQSLSTINPSSSFPTRFTFNGAMPNGLPPSSSTGSVPMFG